MRLRLHTRVTPEFLEAHAWYADRSVRAAENFALRFDATLDRIAEHPLAHAPWRSIFRRARIAHYPYLLLFHVSKSVVSILALVHQRRDPRSVLSSVRTRWVRFS
jgi:plasmid stabilization system protein ParE